MPTMGLDTPELDKESAAKDAGSQEIGEFLDWLFNTQQVHFMVWDHAVQEKPCGVRQTVGEEVDDLRRLELELAGGDPSTVVPIARTEHPGSCRRCGGTGYITTGEMADWIPAGPPNITYWLAKYFDIDMDKADTERRALLDVIRAGNRKATGG